MAVEEVGVRLLAEDANKFDKEMRESRAAFDSFIDALEAGTRGIDSSMARSEGAIANFTVSSEDNFNRIGAASEIVIGALRRIGEMAVNALVSATGAVVEFGQDSVNVAGDFEATLNRFSAVTGSSLESAGMDVEDFSDLFLEMGAKTQFSAQEAAEAAVNLAKGGIEPLEIASGTLAATLGLAAAGELDLATSAEILAKQLGVWSDKGVTAIQITDLLAQAANASTVDVDELANGLANVAGRAAGMGVEYEELVQTMALIAPGFESASTAGTSLNNFLARLIPATEKAEEAMQDLGLVTANGQSVFFDAEGNFIGMEGTIGLLTSATAGLSEEERAMAFNIIFGNDAMGAAIGIVERGVPGYLAMGESMNAAGGAAEQAAERQKGYNFALESMRGSVETLQIVLGTALLPMLTDLIDNHITPGINSFLEFSQAILESEDPMGALVAKVDELLPGFKDFLTTIQNIPTRLAEISSSLQSDFAPEIALVQSIIENAMLAIDTVTQAVLGALGEAWEEFTRDFSDNDWKGLIEAFGILWESLQPVILTVLAALGIAILGFVGAVTGVLSGILNAADFFVQTLTGIALSVSVIVQGYVDVFGGAADLVRAIFDGNTKDIMAAFSRMKDGVIEIIMGVFGLAFSVIVGGAATILSFIGGFIDGVVGFFQSLYDSLVGHSIIPDLVNDIITWISELPVRALVFVAEMVDGIKALFTETDWAAIGQGIIDGIIGGITGMASNLTAAAQQAASDAYTAVTDFLGMESPSRLFMEVGEMTMEGFALGIDAGALKPIMALEGALSTLALDAPTMMPSMAASPAMPSPSVINNYNGDTVYQGDSFGVNVRTAETSGKVGNVIRGLQAVNKVRSGG